MGIDNGRYSKSQSDCSQILHLNTPARPCVDGGPAFSEYSQSQTFNPVGGIDEVRLARLIRDAILQVKD